MSTTISQKTRNAHQDSTENVSECLISPVLVGSEVLLNQDALVAGPSNPKSPRIENSVLKRLRASLKGKTTSEIKKLLAESQREREREGERERWGERDVETAKT